MAGFIEKRVHVRYICDGGVEVRQEDANGGFWGTLTDISLDGCYVQTFSPMQPGTRLRLVIQSHNLEIRGFGIVAAAHPGVGMGIKFLEMADVERQKLQTLIKGISSAASA